MEGSEASDFTRFWNLRPTLVDPNLQPRLPRLDSTLDQPRPVYSTPLFQAPILAMRQKRAKAYKRLMQTYSLTFGFRQPYQVLGAFAHLSPPPPSSAESSHDEPSLT